MITQEELKKHLHYDPLTGIFTRKISISNRVKVGDIAGNTNKRGYVFVRVNSKKYRVHSLVFLYMDGYIPKEEIDHIDRNPSNNRRDNLRIVTPSQNKMNSNKRKDNNCLYKGVRLKKNYKIKPYEAKITKNRKQIYLGMFETVEEAAKAYDEAAIKLFGEYANLNFPIKEEKII